MCNYSLDNYMKYAIKMIINLKFFNSYLYKKLHYESEKFLNNNFEERKIDD